MQIRQQRSVLRPEFLSIGAVRAVVEKAGIGNIRTKCLRSNNPVNVIKATFEGLKSLRTAEEVAAMRGISVENVTK